MSKKNVPLSARKKVLRIIIYDYKEVLLVYAIVHASFVIIRQSVHLLLALYKEGVSVFGYWAPVLSLF
jgi:hypothetical protein